MIAIVGLGNPGPEYRWTRHNAGFLVLEKFAGRHGLSFRKSPLYESVKFGSILIVRPLTYMNRCGEALKSIRSKHPIEEFLAVSDDFHLPVGRLRLRERGSDGGHNGLKSLISAWGAEFPRIRLGVGEPDPGIDSATYVLGRFSPEERSVIEPVFDWATDLLEAYCEGGYPALQNAYSRIESYPETKGSGSQSPKED
jgi:peptidyl-tRNA hydrolase, PTH1 family